MSELCVVVPVHNEAAQIPRFVAELRRLVDEVIVGTAVMFGLAVLGLYVSRLFDEVKGRPRSIAMEKLPPA
ncbi:MAG TPA: hypothetical protein VF883_15580 [Thermoanaerobaculia bacterium]|jgi:hypothetical protein